MQYITSKVLVVHLESEKKDTTMQWVYPLLTSK